MISTILKEVKEYKTVSVLTPVAMILEVVMETLIPLLMAKIIDEGVSAGNMSVIVRVGLYMVIAALLSLTFGSLGGIWAAKASTGLAKNLRMTMYEKIQTYAFSNIDKFSTSSLVTRLTTDVTNIQNAYQMILRMCMRAPASMIIAMTMAFIINARLAMIYLCAVVCLMVCIILILKSATKYFKQIFIKYDALNESVQENITAIREVKAYVREDFETDKFHKASHNIYNMFVKAETIVSNMVPSMMLTVDICIILISWCGAKMIVQNELSTGQLMSLLAYCLNILLHLMMLSFIFVMITMSEASAKRISEVLNEVPDMKNCDNPLYEISDGSIEFENVSFKYYEEAEKPILSNINIKIESGETIGIIGGTGSAKTSLISLISRLYDVSKGRVLVGHRDVKQYDMETLREQISVVLQKNVLFSGTVFENLSWGNENATLEDCITACQMAAADEFIEKLPQKYYSKVEQGGVNFSGGQRQRLCIARALMKHPRVLILDDSTSAVDTATDAKIREAFATKIPDTTKLIIAQRISSVMYADRIIVMDDGKISGFGTHDELLKNNEIYREVYSSQMGEKGDFDEV